LEVQVNYRKIQLGSIARPLNESLSSSASESPGFANFKTLETRMLKFMSLTVAVAGFWPWKGKLAPVTSQPW
jgi:hypothetical protein